MSVSDRLAQEDHILREIRATLSGVKAVTTTNNRNGTVYASAPITSGLRLYQQAKTQGFAVAGELRLALPEIFHQQVFLPNLKQGEMFGASLRKLHWRQVIVPGLFFAKGWTQEHYMSLWRQVIVRHARAVALCQNWEWSLGCSEEFLIALQHQKRLLDGTGKTMRWTEGLGLIRKAMDKIDGLGFEIKPHYDLWRQATLTLEAIKN
jgi:hypothetical protein